MNLHDKSQLVAIRDYIESELGLLFTDRQLDIFASKLQRTFARSGSFSAEKILQQIKDQPQQMLADLSSSLTVGETYFFRNRSQFDALQQVVLPELLKQLGDRGVLNVWSAGCSTGEEPYSLALWIKKYAPALWPKRVRIIATDLNQRALEKAQKGSYTNWAFRQVDSYWRTRFATEDDKNFLVDPSLQEVITFQQHNLSSGRLPLAIAPSSVSLVFCRNVLIYFGEKTTRSVLQLFRSALTTDGYLFVGHAECVPSFRQWRVRYQTGTFYYQPPKQEVGTPEKLSVANPQLSLLSSLNVPNKPKPGYSSAAAKPVRPAEPPATGLVDVDGLMQNARELANAGEFESAYSACVQLVQTDKTNVQAYVLFALVCEQLGKWSESQGALKKVLFLDKKLVLGHYLLAVLEEKRDDKKSSLRHYRAVCNLLRSVPGDTRIELGEGLTAACLVELSQARSRELESAGTTGGAQ